MTEGTDLIKRQKGCMRMCRVIKRFWVFNDRSRVRLFRNDGISEENPPKSIGTN